MRLFNVIMLIAICKKKFSMISSCMILCIFGFLIGFNTYLAPILNQLKMLERADNIVLKNMMQRVTVIRDFCITQDCLSNYNCHHVHIVCFYNYYKLTIFKN